MIEKIAGQISIGSLSSFQTKRWSPSVSSNSDEASFSVFAVELARVSGELRNAPEVRQDLVDDFRNKVANGEYHPPLEGIAHQLFLAGIMDNRE